MECLPSSRPNPVLPLDVCLIVGEPFAGLVIEHHPKRARWITQAGQLKFSRRKMSAVMCHAFFKDAMLGPFCYLQLLFLLLWCHAGSLNATPCWRIRLCCPGGR
jgi:hypothetical protein